MRARTGRTATGSSITVCRDLMPLRLLQRLVPPPLLQLQARALARYVFDDPRGNVPASLYLSLLLSWTRSGLYALAAGSRKSKIATFFLSGIVKNSACVFFFSRWNRDLAGLFVASELVSLTFFFCIPLQVYSFVPIPGAQQHKRPRRRYEEIERMYKCGWNGCEKAYGTLNHLNAHVTMQSHGAKRTPEGEITASFPCVSHILAPSICPRSCFVARFSGLSQMAGFGLAPAATR
jgi:hypothetical protein